MRALTPLSRPGHARAAVCALAVLAVRPAAGQEKLFSGPQPGEKITPFRVLEVAGANAGKEADYIAEWKGAPAALVFVHGVERSMVPLLGVLDQYGAEKQAAVKTLFVFLTDDRVAFAQRLPLIRQSLRLRAPAVISVDGPEGPGNYGLNKKCLVTLVLARNNQVTASFALVQPGIADAPGVLSEMAKLAGDASPPSAEELQTRRQAVPRDQPAAPARPNAGAAADFSRFDLNTPEGLREALRALIGEVQNLRREIAALRRTDPAPARPRPAAEIPGAAPTDPKLLGLLRAFIQPTNDNAAVDRVVGEVETYVKGNPALTKQAVDGWVRVLFLKYGTPYAQQAGAKLVERLGK